MSFPPDPYLTPFTPQPSFMDQQAANAAQLAAQTLGEPAVSEMLRNAGGSDFLRQQAAADAAQRAAHMNQMQHVQQSMQPLVAPASFKSTSSASVRPVRPSSAEAVNIPAPAVGSRVDALASKNLDNAIMSFFLWFLFYIGALGSLMCLYRAHAIRRAAKAQGVMTPTANLQAALVSIAAFIAFPTVAVLITMFVHH